MTKPSAHRERAVEEIRRLVIEAMGQRRAAVILFGSCATGKAVRSSDVDVGILPLEDVPPGFLEDLSETLEESRIPYKVDLVDLRKVSPEFRRRVEKEGIWWRR